MLSFELGFGLALRLLLLLAIALRFFGPLRRRLSGRATRAGRSRATAEPPKRDVFLQGHPLLALLVVGGIPFTVAFLLLWVAGE